VRIKRTIATVMVSFLFVLPINGQYDGKKHERHRKLWDLLTTLSPADRKKFDAARKQAMANPDVAAAGERRRKADEEYHTLLHREMLKNDPSLAPILEKLSELRKHHDF
jgi:hypothetical protein